MTDQLCAICGLVMDNNRASCNQCGEQFHLALRVDQNATDCGDAWIDEDVQALVFGCNRCLGLLPAAKTDARRYVRRPGASAKSIARARPRGGKS